MFRTTRFASKIALALALAGGVAFASPALAQEYSKDFIAAYQPIADVVNAEGGDIAAVSARFEPLVSISDSVDEQFAAGNLILSAGTKTENAVWQRRGIELQLASGKVPPERVAQFQWVLGNLAFQQQDYAVARTALQAAVAAGWNEGDPTGLIAETYFRSDDHASGLAYIQQQIAAHEGAGHAVPEQWLLMGLRTAYQSRQTEPALDFARQLVEANPTKTNWTYALQVVNAMGGFEPNVMLDMLRLMRETDSLTARGEYERYISAADPRVMSNELDSVLAEAAQDGVIARSDPYFTQVNAQIQSRKADDRREADAFFREGMGDPSLALTSADVLYSLDDFARAEQLYANAMNGPDPQTARLRMGIAQVKQGKFDEAQQTFAAVTGPRALVAQFWGIYAANRAG